MSQQFDYVIVGAGSAGCVLANRLSEDPSVTVCILEAGGRDTNPWIHIPAGYVKTMVNPSVNWLFDTVPDEATGNRPIPVPRGRVLGGSSSINGLIYVRGNARDYDVWAQLGNRGWSYDDVLPYFRKAEHREGNGDAKYRGTGGPLNVADVSETDPLLDQVIDAAENAGFPRNPDYNGQSQEGFGYFQTTMKNGRRWSAYRGYLHPAMGRPNLTVIARAHATRINFQSNRAFGVSYRQGGKAETVNASREVILSAGAIQSPQLLELSGVGQPELLKRSGIDVVHALPGVGENLQDHYIVRHTFQLKEGVHTLNERLRGLSLAGELMKYALGRRGGLSMPAGVVAGFIRARPGVEIPDIQHHIAHATFSDPKRRIFDPYPGLTIAPCQVRPTSRGSIHIASSDPSAAPRIQPNFLHELEDRETLVAGMRAARTIASTKPLADLVVEETRPGPDVDSDDKLLEYARQTGATVYHPVGTCRMGAGPEAVVDDQLRVHGLDGLRVVDASVMPNVTSGNTNAPTIMIAEKAADLMKASA